MDGKFVETSSFGMLFSMVFPYVERAIVPAVGNIFVHAVFAF